MSNDKKCYLNYLVNVLQVLQSFCGCFFSVAIRYCIPKGNNFLKVNKVNVIRADSNSAWQFRWIN